MSVHLLNLLPTTTLAYKTPFEVLFGIFPGYHHLRVFGCLCYPNLSATTPHKLTPPSTACVYLGPSENHRRYRFLDLITNKVIISQHVVFDETHFPFPSFKSPTPISEYDSLLDSDPVDSSVPVSVPPVPPTGRNQPPSPTGPPPPTDPLAAPPSPVVASTGVSPPTTPQPGSPSSAAHSSSASSHVTSSSTTDISSPTSSPVSADDSSFYPGSMSSSSLGSCGSPPAPSHPMVTRS